MRKRKISISGLFALCFIAPLISLAQVNDSTMSKRDFFKREVKADSIFSLKAKSGIVPFFIHSMGEQAQAPFHMSGKQMLRTAGVLAITGILFHYDEEIDKAFKPIKDRNPFIKKVSPEFTQLGDYYGYGLIAGIFGVSALTKNYKPFHTSILAAQSAITAGIWVRVGKVLTGRMRPGATYNDLNFNHDHWFGPFGQFNSKNTPGRSVAAFDAFPSGHTAAAFAMATSFAKQYRDKKAVPVILYSVAGLIGVSRLVEHDHWASDILPGAIIGYLCADQVYRYDKKLKAGRQISQWQIFPSINQGLGLTVRWTGR